MLKSFDDIIRDRHHGSTDLFLAFIRLLQEMLSHPEPDLHEFRKWIDAVCSARSNMALFVALRRTITTVLASNPDIDRLRKHLKEMEHSIKTAHHRMVNHALQRVKHHPGPIALYSRSTILFEFARAVISDDPSRMFYLAQARHHDEGIPMARSLMDLTPNVRLMTDPLFFSMIPTAGSAWVSCDFAIPQGIGNKVGTAVLAILSENANVPLYVFVMHEKVIPPEEAAPFLSRIRDMKEVEQPDGIPLWSADLDLTPWQYFRAIITPTGVVTDPRTLFQYR